ncbi:MAG: iron ABC transporter permease [Phycisphaeraceae bacterium]|jgi:iron(III) transport system permease protein|nr:iron ABC transporter permease [Phycisphaeraceae bacterium]MDP7346932.1 iron ABC transporter permease [Phycisphaeraceae bacterium]
MRPRTLYRYGLFTLLLVLLAMFLVWPIVLTVRGGFVDTQGELTLRYVLDVFKDPLSLQGLVNSLLIAACTTVLCLTMTLPLASLATRYEFPGKALLTSLVLVPLILPPFVGAIGVRSLLGRFGALNTLLMDLGVLDASQPGIDFLGGAVGGRFWGVVVMEALHLYPILFLNITAAMANLDPTLDEAAENLGAGRWRRFWRISFPLILPGVFAGSTIVFIWSFTELGTPLMFDYYTVTPVQVFWGIQEVESSPQPYALTVVMLTVAVLIYLAGKFVFGGKACQMQSKASVASVMTRLTGVRALGAVLLFTVLIGVAILPHAGVVLSSFSVDGAWYRSVLPSALTVGHYERALSHPMAVGSIQNSLVYAVSAMLICIVGGLAISYLTVRAKVRGGWLLDSLAMLPLAVPGLVMAFGYVAMTLHWPFDQLARLFDADGSTDVASIFRVTGNNPNPIMFLIIAYAVRRLPYVVRSVSAGLQQTSVQLEEAALNLGASTMTAIRRVVLPLVMANLIAGGILTFSFAMLEVSDSLILAQKQEHYPITKAIFDLFNRLGDGPYIASAMGVWGMGLLMVTLVGAGMLMGKRMGVIFRV